MGGQQRGGRTGLRRLSHRPGGWGYGRKAFFAQAVFAFASVAVLLSATFAAGWPYVPASAPSESVAFLGWVAAANVGVLLAMMAVTLWLIRRGSSANWMLVVTAIEYGLAVGPFAYAVDPFSAPGGLMTFGTLLAGLAFLPRRIVAIASVSVSLVVLTLLLHGDQLMPHYHALFLESSGHVGQQPSEVFRRAVFTLSYGALIYIVLDGIVISWRQDRRGLREVSQTDSLTGLGNRGHAMRVLQHELLVAEETGLSLAVVIVDVDRFKSINDEYGHSAGDEVLRQFALHLVDALRDSDNVGRIGGEEFLVTLAGVPADRVQSIVDRCRKLVASARIEASSDQTIEVTASFGVAMYPEDALDVTTLLELADRAMYRAKQLGRNRVMFAQHLRDSSMP